LQSSFATCALTSVTLAQENVIDIPWTTAKDARKHVAAVQKDVEAWLDNSGLQLFLQRFDHWHRPF
jgi:hypothetical protein